jgi:hypothetical protein
MHKPNLLYSYSKTAQKLKILLWKYKWNIFNITVVT